MTEPVENDTAADERDTETTVPSIHDVVLDILLSRLAEDRYPSSAMLDMVEEMLTPARRDDFAEILLDKIATDRYPSVPLMQRLLRLTAPA